MDITSQLEKLRAYVEERRFSGYDPYDALNSPILRALTFGQKWGRIACTQALRRLPFSPRPLLLIAPSLNAKALGLFLEGYARLHRRQPRDEYREAAATLVGRLAALRAPTPRGHGWGYNFDWQSRAFYLPKGTPTVVCSAFVAHALLDAAETFGFDDARNLAYPSVGFILHDLNRIDAAEGAFCFSYSPLDRYCVHNANLLGASVLLRFADLTGSEELGATAFTALRYTLNHQHPDGSWYYSESPAAHWVDSFHTGFNLECLRRFLRAGASDGCRRAYDCGVRFYADNFFLSDGTPRYYADRTYPIDIHSAAEAISFFVGEGDLFQPLVERILRYCSLHLWDERGFFYCRKGPRVTNRVAYMRWGQAWMFRALAAYQARSVTRLARHAALAG